MLDINDIKDTIVKFIVDPLIILDAKKAIRIVNEATLYLLGYKEEELIGKSVEIIFPESKISILRRENVEKIIGSGTILNVDTYYQAKNGQEIPVLFSSSIMNDNDGGMLWIACIAKDITKRKKEEEELQAAYARLKETRDQLIQAEKLNAIGLLASGVAHEVKNPLGIIIQGVNYLEAKMHPRENDIIDTLNIIKNSVQRANKIVNALLDFSRAKSLDLQPEDINSILKSALDLVKTNIKFENIDIIFEADNSISKVLVDKNRIEQVFVNLLMNAIQAMPKGGKIIIRSQEKLLEELTHDIIKKNWGYLSPREKVIMVKIEDSGTGIPKEILEKLFNPFVTTKGLKGGSGIGLYVSRNIIDMHRGLIDIESKYGEGAKAIILLKPFRSKEVRYASKENIDH